MGEYPAIRPPNVASDVGGIPNHATPIRTQSLLSTLGAEGGMEGWGGGHGGRAAGPSVTSDAGGIPNYTTPMCRYPLGAISNYTIPSVTSNAGGMLDYTTPIFTTDGWSIPCHPPPPRYLRRWGHTTPARPRRY